MEVSEFLKHLKYKSSCIIIKNDFADKYSYKVKELKMLKNMTEDIFFDCNFDGSGRCRGGKSFCCCSGCYEAMGYLKLIFEKDLPYYAEHFKGFDKSSNDRGFWRKKTGCVLERKYRANLCVTYYCKTYDENGQTKIGKELRSLYKKIDTIEKFFERGWPEPRHTNGKNTD